MSLVLWDREIGHGQQASFFKLEPTLTNQNLSLTFRAKSKPFCITIQNLGLSSCIAQAWGSVMPWPYLVQASLLTTGQSSFLLMEDCFTIIVASIIVKSFRLDVCSLKRHLLNRKILPLVGWHLKLPFTFVHLRYCLSANLLWLYWSFLLLVSF